MPRQRQDGRRERRRLLHPRGAPARPSGLVGPSLRGPSVRLGGPGRRLRRRPLGEAGGRASRAVRGPGSVERESSAGHGASLVLAGELLRRTRRGVQVGRRRGLPRHRALGEPPLLRKGGLLLEVGEVRARLFPVAHPSRALPLAEAERVRGRRPPLVRGGIGRRSRVRPRGARCGGGPERLRQMPRARRPRTARPAGAPRRPRGRPGADGRLARRALRMARTLPRLPLAGRRGGISLMRSPPRPPSTRNPRRA